MITFSLLAVVVADGIVTQGRVDTALAQSRLVAAQDLQRQLQVTVAQHSAPQIVMSKAKQLGMVASGQVGELSPVSLSIPLPAPDTGSAASASAVKTGS